LTTLRQSKDEFLKSDPILSMQSSVTL